MENRLTKRGLLAAGLGLGAGLAATPALAQLQTLQTGRAADKAPPVVRRQAKTTPLFKAPGNWANAMSLMPDGPGGVWIAQQRHDGEPEAAWLVDWNGKVLKTVMTEARDTSGMAYGDGFIWMGSNNGPDPVTKKNTFNGIFQTDMNSKTVSVHQVPFGAPNNGGGVHGAFWQDGRLWLASNRLISIMRIEPKTWQVEYMMPIIVPGVSRFHGIAWDNGAIWVVTGNDSHNYQESKPGLAKLDARTGALLEIVEFLPGSCDPHGLVLYNGSFYSCDAGEHPNWPIGGDTIPLEMSTTGGNSPFSGYIFRIDMV